jgi:hypothetical protein
MPQVRIVASNGRVKRSFPSTIHPDDATGALELLRYWSDRLGLTNATIQVYDKRCRCRRKFDARN